MNKGYKSVLMVFLFLDIFVCPVLSKNSRTIRKFENQNISAIAVSPDDTVMACALGTPMFPSARETEVVALIDLKRRRLLHKLKAAFGAPNSVAFSRTGRLIAAAVGTGGWKRREGEPPYPKILGEAYVWEIKTGKLKHKLTLRTGQALAIVFSPDSRYAAIGCGDGTLRLWELSTGKSKWVVSGQGGPLISVDFSPDGKTILTGNWNRDVRIWDAKTGNLKRSLRAEDNVYKVMYSPRGEFIASAGHDKLRLWSSRTGKQLMALGEGNVKAIQFSANGKLVAAVQGGSLTDTITIWGLPTGRVHKTLDLEHISDIAFTSHFKQMVVLSWLFNSLYEFEYVVKSYPLAGLQPHK